jgi:hypothetical protein
MFNNLAGIAGTSRSSLDAGTREELSALLQNRTGLTASQRTRVASLERKAIAAERAALNKRVDAMKKASFINVRVLNKIREAIRTAPLTVGPDGAVARDAIHAKIEALEELQHSIRTGGLVDLDETGRTVALSFTGSKPAAVMPLTTEMVGMAAGRSGHDENNRPVALSQAGRAPVAITPLMSEMVKLAGGADPRL